MANSMTAFARMEHQGKFGLLVWEIRSLNHRFLDVHLRFPDSLRYLENDARAALKKKVYRGKLDAYLHFTPDESLVNKLSINQSALQLLVDGVSTVGKSINQDQQVNLMEVLSWPGVIQKDEFDKKALGQEAMSTLIGAIDALVKVRNVEGENLSKITLQKLGLLKSLVSQAQQAMPEVILRHKQKMTISLQEIMGEVDAIRLEQEIAILAQKMDIEEEMDRLSTHLTEVENVLKKSEPIGRRLDFLMQELHREANTLGSKSQDIKITAVALKMKVIIEQMREQVQNIE